MRNTYSIDEVQAKFRDALRDVRKGDSVIVTYRGEEIAEIRPIDAERSKEAKLSLLERRGVIVPRGPRQPLDPVARRSGALERFLESR